MDGGHVFHIQVEGGICAAQWKYIRQRDPSITLQIETEIARKKVKRETRDRKFIGLNIY